MSHDLDLRHARDGTGGRVLCSGREAGRAPLRDRDPVRRECRYRAEAPRRIRFCESAEPGAEREAAWVTLQYGPDGPRRSGTATQGSMI